MNKKGMETRLIVYGFYIILVILIGYLLFNYMDQEITGESHTQIVLAKKLGLTLDTASSSNGELNLNYNLSGTFSVKSVNGFLTIKKENSGIPGSYYVANDLNFNFETNLLKIHSIKGGVDVDE